MISRRARCREKNFGTYEIPRFSWLSNLDLILVDNPDVPDAQGGSDPPIPVLGALLATAIHEAVGVRLFQLPMTPGGSWRR